MLTPDFARQWLAQITAGARALAEVERQERGRITDEQALADAEALLDAAPPGARPERACWSGFVEQQRLFARAREREPGR